MTKETISPLRQRMIEDMTVRNLTAKTQSDYIRAVKSLATFLGRSPDTGDALGQKFLQGRAVEGGTREAAIVVAIRDQAPASCAWLLI